MNSMYSANLSPERLRLETWPIERLIPSARNARTHSDAQVAGIAGSIRAFGFSNPILIGTEGDVIAGHGRLVAARQLGLTEVPVIVLSGLNELQQRQLILADNRIALNAGWDLKILQSGGEGSELTQRRPISFGVHDSRTQALASASTTGLTDEDQVPELEGNAISATGDIWCLGRHRICCGDSTDPAAVAAVLAGAAPQLMVTDPPYGVDYDPAWRH
jgi:hypothetical protein